MAQAALTQPQAPWAENADFAADLHVALSQTHRMSPKYFYDARGSALFDAICELPEYYPTRTELAILRRHAEEIARKIGPDAELIEFGAGSCTKVQILLDALAGPQRYLPIDICAPHLAEAAQSLRGRYPELEVTPVIADYTRPLILPPRTSRRRVGFFAGSTLGNFSPEEALQFLRSAADALRGGSLLLGVDLVKDPAVLHAAYNDAAGVTADFNLNLLHRANRELGTDFDLSQFAHSAFYNAPLKRIEMHLISRCRQTVRMGSQSYHLDEADSLHTENSHKFTVHGLHHLAALAGWRAETVWTDPQHLFSLHWLNAD